MQRVNLDHYYDKEVRVEHVLSLKKSCNQNYDLLCKAVCTNSSMPRDSGPDSREQKVNPTVTSESEQKLTEGVDALLQTGSKHHNGGG